MASETGASRDQIERTAKQWATDAKVNWDDISIDEQAQWCAGAETVLGYLVRDDERIVLADDLRIVLSDLTYETEASSRLRAAIGTPTAAVCPRCGERTYVSPRTGRTCVISECGWRERES